MTKQAGRQPNDKLANDGVPKRNLSASSDLAAECCASVVELVDDVARLTRHHAQFSAPAA